MGATLKFTWASKVHGRTKKIVRLDRVFTNVHWSLIFHPIEVNHLIKLHSDHSPLQVQCRGTFQSHRPIVFRLWTIWYTYDDFKQFVEGNLNLTA